MKILHFLLILFAANLFSQNYRFIYEYKFAPDNTKTDSIINNYMYLESDGMQSNFINETKFKIDSIKNSSNDMGEIIKAGRMDKNLHYNISKDYKKNEIVYHTKFTTIDFRIFEYERPNWKIFNEILKIANYQCQKAETFYKGRKWTAYFTKEIPINDGPYKFSGLPGLIVKIFSEDNSHQFSLIQVKKMQNSKFQKFKNERTITDSEYKEYLKNYLPTISDISAVNVNGNGTSSYIMKDGNVININISKETLEKYRYNQDKLGEIIMKKLAGSTVNPIELEE